MKWNMKTCLPLATKVYNIINQRRAAMPHDKDLPIRKICGKKLWDTLTDEERHFAGRFVSVAVGLGMLGLVQAAEQDQSNHWRYRRP